MDPLIHEPVRLKAMLTLLTEGEVSFSQLLNATGTTEGNLSRHMQKLEEAGYVEVRKFFEGKRPKTTYKLTEKGKKALKEYLETIERIIKSVKEGGGA